MIHRNYAAGAILALALVGCSPDSDKKTDVKDADTEVIAFQVDMDTRFQTIRNFGASDAWSVQFVGKNWPIESRTRIAELLFSTETGEDGSPVGIGLSAWRFNIGGGSAEQGTQSGITDEWRRAECFLNNDGTYNWSRQAGQLWFLSKAREMGVEDFIGFVNSPPVHYTKNGKAWSDDGVSSNLAAEYYGKYANFLANVTEGIAKETGVTLDYISPFNEPQWEWKCCNQEGSPWNNNEIAKAAKAINDTLLAGNIETKIEITEAGQIDFLYSDSKEPNIRNNQIEEFFNPGSDNYVGGMNNVARKIAGHSYWSTWDFQTLIDTRLNLLQKIQETDPTLEYWMSEYCILEENTEIKGSGRDLGMDPAIYIARVIQADLIMAQASAWHWWLAVSPYDYKDGLVYIDLNKQSGQIYESKMLWALGHFSRFIRPGSVRVSIERQDGTSIYENINGVLASAYITLQDEIVVVLLNQLKSDKKVSLSGVPSSGDSAFVFQTTKLDGENLKLVDTLSVSDFITVPARSLVTCVIK